MPTNNLFPFSNLPTDLEKKSPFGTQRTSLGRTNLGVPAISWISFYGGADNLTELLQISECLITVTQNPRIIKQNTISSNGSVKTWIGLEDYEIQIEGYIFNVNPDGSSAANMEGIYPKQRMQALNSLIVNQGQNLGISIVCPFLNLFGEEGGIDFVVVSKVDIEQEEGQYSQQKFSMTLESDSYPDSMKIFSPYFA